jgi:hypothetical protein
MKINLIGASKGHGKSFKNDVNGVEYSIPSIRFLTSAESYKSKKVDHTVEAYGQESSEMNITDELFEKVKTFKMPCDVELIKEDAFYGGKFVTKLTDIKVL